MRTSVSEPVPLAGVPRCRLLMWCALSRRFFDLIDIDSFGGDSFAGPAMGAVRHGGLLCLTSTAGPVAGGRDPLSALALYGTQLAPVPHANEQVGGRTHGGRCGRSRCLAAARGTVKGNQRWHCM